MPREPSAARKRAMREVWAAKGSRLLAQQRLLTVPDNIKAAAAILTQHFGDCLPELIDALSRDAKMEYLQGLPNTIPADRILVHSNVQPTKQLGSRGFRAWLQPPQGAAVEVELCPCAWGPELGPHYRVRSEALTG